MSIISLTYLIFIIIIMFLYFGMPKKFQWTVLLAGSAVFYLSAGISCVGAILATIVSQYLLAARLDRMNCELESRLQESGLCGKEKAALKRAAASSKKKYVVCSILINIGLLCFVKYTGVFFEKIHILVPLGISFYTFKSLGYVIDVYRGKEKAERNILRFALFISYFPKRRLFRDRSTAIRIWRISCTHRIFSIIAESRSGCRECCGAISRSW